MVAVGVTRQEEADEIKKNACVALELIELV